MRVLASPQHSAGLMMFHRRGAGSIASVGLIIAAGLTSSRARGQTPEPADTRGRQPSEP
jgi:hypothetical protein